VSEDKSLWRFALDAVVDGVSAEQFAESITWLRERYGDEPADVGGAYAAVMIDLFAENAGLFATLTLPLAEVPAALAEIRQALAHLDFDTGRSRLKKKERRYYDHFAERARVLFAEVGEVLEALFNCYVAGDYDPAADPDSLVAEALAIAERDLEQARRLIVRAGAIGLHSHLLWWRWSSEGYGPAGHWLSTMAILIDSYTGGGETLLGSYSEAHERMQAREAEPEEPEEPETPEAEPSPVDGLIEELFEQGQQKWKPEQLALCQAHREEAIHALIELVADEDLQLEDAPAEGYAPIHAVELLGELQAVEAIRPLIDIVADVEPDAIIRDAAIYALIKIGPPACEPVLTLMRYSQILEAKLALAQVVSEIGQRDEQAYQVLLDVWDEATWGEGRCLLAHAMVRTGGEQAIPVLQAALEDPGLDERLDYNEIADALAELGIEAPPPDHLVAPFGALDELASLVRSPVLALSDPKYLEEQAGDLLENLRADPDGLARLHAFYHLHKIAAMTAAQLICLPADFSIQLVSQMFEAVEVLAFDAPVRDYSKWMREAYQSLAERAGPEFKHWLSGILYALRHYLAQDYDIAEDTDQLLAAARGLAPDDETLPRLFGRAGALVLHGRPLWSRWPLETDSPLSDWLVGLFEFRRSLECTGHIPLRPNSEEYTPELPNMLMEAHSAADEPTPPVSELLDLLITQKQDSLSPSQRRRFANQHAAIVPHLIGMVESRAYWYEDGPGGGWAAILAARLLGELRAIQSAGALVNAVANSRPGDVIHEAALFSLMAIGRPALSAVQTYFRYGRDVETKTSLAEVLGRIGQRSTDSFDLLRQVWEEAGWVQNRRMVALAFGDLEDRRAAPLLKAALQDSGADVLDMDYVGWALQQLGVPVELPERSPQLETPAPGVPRLMYDETGHAVRLKHTAWGEPLCPDCGKPLALDESGEWGHPAEKEPQRPAPRKKRKRKSR
jgi:HEAT repeat protein